MGSAKVRRPRAPSAEQLLASAGPQLSLRGREAFLEQPGNPFTLFNLGWAYQEWANSTAPFRSSVNSLNLTDFAFARQVPGRYRAVRM
jgi:hypothetical protein